MKTLLVLAAVYGTLSGSGLVEAPRVVMSGGYNTPTRCLSEAQANALGYRLVVDDPPECASNEVAVAVGYDFDSDTSGRRIRRLYRIETVEPTARRWTPLSIKRSAVRLGQWDALKAFLVAANAYDDFVMAQYEAEDDAQFVALMDAARAQFGDATVAAILDGAEVEP